MSPKRRPPNNDVEILIAEDSPTQAEQLRNLLDKAGYRVRAAANGKEALAAALKDKPSLVISDIVMPEMDGFALCKEIKSKKGLKDIPVILMTALSSAQDVIKGLECGADNFIRKPCDEKYLLSRIEYILVNAEVRKSQKMQMGVEIYLSGKKHLITAERQQMVDLLISIYEEAVQMNSELKERQTELTRSYQSLNGLYHIAVGLNGASSESEVAQEVLERAAEFPAVQAGWLLLKSGETDFRVVAANNLPPALRRPGALDGDCRCRHELLSGQLGQAVNIFECERLQQANGESGGLRYHASVPLSAGGRVLGILNLAGQDQGMFSNEDLKVLHGVGNQVGVALERVQLVEGLEKKVEERTAALREEIAQRKLAQEEAQRNLERIRALHEIDVAISSSLDLRAVLNVLLEKIDPFLPGAAADVRLINRERGKLEGVAARNINEREWKAHLSQPGHGRGHNWTVFQSRQPLAVSNVQKDPATRHPDFLMKQGFVSYLGVPLIVKEDCLGVLSFYTKEEHKFSDQEVELLATLGGQAAIAIHNAQLYEQMVKANKIKDEFLSVMSHELRTPLNVVVGYTGMIKDGLLGEINPQQAEALEKVINRANDQLSLVNNILYATVLEVEKINVDIHEVSLEDFLNQLKLSYEAPINKELTLNWDYPDDLPIIRTDSAKLKQILHNLIDNALKFTDKGSVTISARLLAASPVPRVSASVGEDSGTRGEGDAGKRLEFKVADTGVGIPKEHIPIIFEKFRQVDSSETRLYGGVGMGLYIVKKFAELMGGTVEVESEPGKGSTFTVRIPAGS